MIHQCYYCGQIFPLKEKLYEHLDVHSKTKGDQEKEKQREGVKKETESKN